MPQCAQNFYESPSHIYCRNSVEWSIRNLKEHFISVLASTHKDFQIHLWCRILPDASLTLNLLYKLSMNSKLSGYAQLHGEFKYNVTPLATPRTQLIFHEKPTVIGTWAAHGVKGYHLGPSLGHYRVHHIYITKTRGERDSDCFGFSTQYSYPIQLFLRKCHYCGTQIGLCPTEPSTSSAIF